MAPQQPTKLTINGSKPEGSPTPSPSSHVDIKDSVHAAELPRASHMPRRLGAHEILPADFWTDNANQDKNFLEFPAIPSEDGTSILYLGAVKSLGPMEERSAVVRTLYGRCDVQCSTRFCEGLERLCVEQVVKIQHYTSGANQGETFVTHTAAECSPMSSQVASRVGSRAPTRPPTPGGS